MTIQFVLLVNKQGQTRLAKYTDQSLSVEERRALEGEIVRKCLARSEKQVLRITILLSGGFTSFIDAKMFPKLFFSGHRNILHRDETFALGGIFLKLHLSP